MSDSDDNTCPLCMEEMDLVDQNFVPCPCGYRVCMWCWHHIRENMNGLCPACRVPYKEDPHAFVEVDRTEVVKKNKEKKQKERQDKKATDKPVVAKVQTIDRKHLHNYRVVQRNLVYIIGVPASIATEETLRRPEYFGQYGRIAKVVVHRNHSSSHATVSAYVTFTFKDDARASIQALEGFWLEGHQVRASFGTTKYCNNFIRGVPCNNPDCVYLHDLGEDEDRFTKEEIQAGYSKLMQQPGRDQILVTGAGGPSGTGKRTTNELVLPPPVFVQDLSVAEKKKQISSSAAMEHRNQFREEAASEEAKAVPSSNSTTSLASLDRSSPSMSHSKTFDGDATNSSSDFPSAPQASATLEQQQQRILLNEERLLRQEQELQEERSECSHVADQGQTQQQRASAAAVTSDESPTSGAPSSPDRSKNTGETSRQSECSSPVLFTSNFSSLVSPGSFNGLGNCAVFPVPISSLSVSIWRNLLQSGTGDDLKVNPYALITIPITELFELTIPPVDAACLSSWPKPVSHYSQGIGASGVTHAPVGQHKYHSASASSASYEASQAAHQHSHTDMNPEQLQQYHQQKAYQQQQQLRANQQFRESQQQQQQQYSSQNQFQQQQQQQQPNMVALQQIFPGVNMSFGGQGGSSSSQQLKR